jgi:hypothetical protein
MDWSLYRWMQNSDDQLWYRVGLVGPGAQFSIDQTGHVTNPGETPPNWWLQNTDDNLWYEVTLVGPGAQFRINQIGYSEPQ